MEQIDTSIGVHAPDFELPGTDGKVHHLGRYLREDLAVAVVFLANQCPNVQQYIERLKQLQAEFGDRGLLVIGINSNDGTESPEDSLEAMKRFAAEHQLNFPYLRDANQDVARSFQVCQTPESFLLDQKGVIRYHGAIDDSPGNSHEVDSAYLQQAIAQLLAKESITINSTETKGSSVKWRSP
ncbi:MULTISPECIES: thioredoxin family protein [Planktothricoides]|uniref:Thioredoxin family protein n=1 Tax=Planktothricoides raciborskii FACHB-1370 TaxID=2949576 RepID=A0ABR8EN84_9CYAN|nr:MULTISPECIES: thioredoxin family protein [Planktothricoides]KOR33734.1 alkyl hydroperoxide reductase [Planktothricoides sp. SR001]MBD2547975.1 thioredoxin family protein [Planktothricoides raciborskii FACHB-1370]MBD2586368.1 thioredoxin family protein [Planktothricoides raciborskii FACHB-1261]